MPTPDEQQRRKAVVGVLAGLGVFLIFIVGMSLLMLSPSSVTVVSEPNVDSAPLIQGQGPAPVADAPVVPEAEFTTSDEISVEGTSAPEPVDSVSE